MVKAAWVQRARTSALRAAIDRQAAAYDDRSADREARSRRIRTVKRDIERALRFREELLEAVRTADAVAGSAIRRLLSPHEQRDLAPPASNWRRNLFGRWLFENLVAAATKEHRGGDRGVPTHRQRDRQVRRLSGRAQLRAMCLLVAR